MNAEQLKNSILQRAVEGKLVEQREEEGTAAELLREIKAEKARLVKEGKLKKEKPLPEIKEEEIPFEIPESWEWVRLPNLVYSVGNKSNQILAKEVKPKGRYAAVSQGQKIIDGYTDCAEKVIADLPVIMFGDHTRNVKYIDFPFVISADGTKFMKPICINPLYLFYWMIITSEQLRNRGYARHYSLLKSKTVPLPPLAEQKRIVAKIEELLPHVEQYGKAHDELTALNEKFPEAMKKSVLQYAMEGRLVEQRAEEGTAKELLKEIKAEKARLVKEGKIKKEKPLPEIKAEEIPFEIPESWEWVRWGDLSQSIQYGYNAPAKEHGRIKMVRISDIHDNIILWDTVPYCDISESDIEAYRLEKNDILFARTGGTVGKSYLVNDRPEEAVYAGYLIRTRYSSLLMPQYLKYFMESQLYWTQLRSGTIATAQPNCNGKTLSKMMLPLPPLAEQKRIVAKIEELLACCGALEK